MFAKKKYTESFRLYEQVLEQKQVYSPQMLLKMAFIKEGLRDYTGAMYYLHLFYTKHPSRSVLKKMEELARVHRLSGYEYSDWDFFKTQFNKYYMKILELMLILAVIVVTIIIFSKRKGQNLNPAFKLLFTCYLVFIFYYINYLSFGKEGIIRNNNVPVMSAPSAGSTWLFNSSKGHKVAITGEQDIWYEIKLKGKKVYIRKNNLLPLP
ncbi:MAG: SH3 domain-containing protein [Hymenobacteraceae bacterium]|nr:SH3 domain-containing protein [Hymenobacteraceae bacterium]MDX5396993.1 SH3 domain-containing protein [Hymenobacteraceae bacterium]MDX5513067.1 SH3 domain-containing protein [Hymenobacteraceae bacterium]